MNIVSKIAVLFLALSILAIPAMAAEEEHIILVTTDSQDDTVTYVSSITVPRTRGASGTCGDQPVLPGSRS